MSELPRPSGAEPQMRTDILQLDILVPVLVYCALLWWVGAA